VAVQDGQVIQSLVSPIGSSGKPRNNICFIPGFTHKFERRNFEPGTNVDWEVVFELPDSGGEVEITVAAWNHRGVEDPYALARIIIAIATASAMGGLGAYFSKELKELVAKVLGDESLRDFVVELLKKLPGGVADGIIGLFFSNDWPECAGDVFKWQQTITSETVKSGLGERSAETLPTDVRHVAKGCRTPHYSLSAHLVKATAFEAAPRPKRVYYIPYPPGKSTDWDGVWRNDHNGPIGAAISHVGPGRIYTVGLSEKCVGRSVVDGEYTPVKEILQKTLPYARNQEPQVAAYAKAAGSTAAADSTLAEVSMSPVGSTSVAGATGARKGGASTGAGASSPPGDSEIPSSVSPPPSPAPSTGTSGGGGGAGEQSDLIESNAAPIMLEDVRTLPLQASMFLGLYQKIEEFENGKVKMSGPLVRYWRAANIAATRADMMLFQFDKLG